MGALQVGRNTLHARMDGKKIAIAAVFAVGMLACCSFFVANEQAESIKYMPSVGSLTGSDLFSNEDQASTDDLRAPMTPPPALRGRLPLRISLAIPRMLQVPLHQEKASPLAMMSLCSTSCVLLTVARRCTVSGVMVMVVHSTLSWEGVT